MQYFKRGNSICKRVDNEKYPEQPEIYVYNKTTKKWQYMHELTIDYQLDWSIIDLEPISKEDAMKFLCNS